jgi:hypothetical protein
VRERLGFHPATSKRCISFGLRDWSDSVNGALEARDNKAEG